MTTATVASALLRNFIMGLAPLVLHALRSVEDGIVPVRDVQERRVMSYGDAVTSEVSVMSV